MKGVIKCSKFLALFAMPLLCLFQFSDVSATKYTVGKIPLTFPTGNYYGSMSIASENAFQIRATSGLTWSNSSIAQNVLGMVDNNGTCEGNGFRSMPFSQDYSDNTTLYSFGFLGLDVQWPQLQNWSSPNYCLTNDKMANYNQHSVFLLANGNVSLGNELTSLLPYRFKYDGFYRMDSRNSDGLHYSNKFDLHNVFGSQGYPQKITRLNIPFLPQTSVSSTFEQGTPITFEGEFIIDLDDPSQLFGLTSSTYFNLRSYYAKQNSYNSEVTSCTWSLDAFDPGDNTGVNEYSLKYSCPTTISSTYFNSADTIPYFRLEIGFDYANSNTKFFQFIFDSSIVVTNNDYTDGGLFDSPVTGSDTHSAPGSAYQNDYSDMTPDYNYSLVNMFNFEFLNPFNPIFNLFSDQNSCQQIPTIASMIHSNETQVCPWFDSTTRNIVTPVLGLASMMLIFGFAVRWLGARSGNLFEDSVDTGNYSFTNKFRSKK